LEQLVTESAALAGPIRIDLWADIACPWCYLGVRRLDAALAQSGEDVVVRHRPFMLNPDLPLEGVPMAGYLEERLGSPEAVAEGHARLTALGQEVGISYDFAAVGKAPNTRLVHHLLVSYDGDPRQHAVELAFYSAYFERGLDVTDAATLVAVTSQVTGESDADVQARLDAPMADLDAAFALGRELGISAVPTFIADAGTDIDPEVGLSAAAVAVQGAQPEEVLRQVLAEARRRARA
jgi:predicted DsbA family dithiol-disulfide isomerase